MMKYFSVFLAIAVLSSQLKKTEGGFVATDKIEAEAYTSAVHSSAMSAECTDGTVYLGDNYPDSVVTYAQVDFGGGVKSVTLSVDSWVQSTDTGDILLHLDNPSNPPFATITVRQNAADYCTFSSIASAFATTPTGLHDLIFTFYRAQALSFVNIDWFTFNSTQTTILYN